jgi:hypothetical protein
VGIPLGECPRAVTCGAPTRLFRDFVGGDSPGDLLILSVGRWSEFQEWNLKMICNHRIGRGSRDEDRDDVDCMPGNYFWS